MFEWNVVLQQLREYELHKSLDLWLLIWGIVVTILDFSHTFVFSKGVMKE